MLNKIIAGWQSAEHEFSQDMLERITVHEMGHAILGILSKHHAKLRKVVLNPSSPKMPGYTIFEQTKSALYIKEALFEHLMILLGGRIAEEVVYNASITTGAINDFEESLKLAERMVSQYGMGEEVLYPSNSEKYKARIDDDVVSIINHAYLMARIVLENCRELITHAAKQLKETGQITADELATIIREKYPATLELRDMF
jgi:cell division protease FtsH